MKLSKQALHMIKVISIIVFISALFGIIYLGFNKSLPFLLGLLIGTIASFIRVYTLDKMVDKVTYESNTKKSYFHIILLMRFSIATIALLIGALIKNINLLGVVIGIFASQISAYSLRFTFNNKKEI